MSDTRAHARATQAPTPLHTMNLHDDDFTLFQLPQRMAQDAAAIDTRWKALQRQAHPDKFTAQGAAAQRVAMQWSVRINEAYQRLKNPLQRASYLCQLHGVALDADNNTTMPAAFLIQQMQWREALDDASNNPTALQQLAHTVAETEAATQAHIQHAIDQQHDYATAAQHIRAWMFIQKFAHSLRQQLFTAQHTD